MPCIVFEYENSRDARGQGGSLDLHAESGQLAIREAGSYHDNILATGIVTDLIYDLSKPLG
jgi:hypothetical protein